MQGLWCSGMGKSREKSSIFIWRSFHHKIFRQNFFRLPELQLFVPCTDSAVIIFYLKCHLKKNLSK